MKRGCNAASESSVNQSDSPDPAIIARYDCGMLGTCHAGLSFGGQCFRRCSPDHEQEALGCRQGTWEGEVLDADGDYECYDYISAPHPFCLPVSSRYWVKCGAGEYELSSQECSTYFLASDTLQLEMTCRDPVTGEFDSEGYCLDKTTSGPTGVWQGER